MTTHTTIRELMDAGLYDTNYDIIIDGIAAATELGERVLKDMGTENLGLHAHWIRDEKDDRQHQQYRTTIITERANKGL